MKKEKDIHVGLCYKPMVLKLGDGYLFKGCFLAANPTWFTEYQTYILRQTHILSMIRSKSKIMLQLNV